MSEFVGSKMIELKQSIEGTQGDVTLWEIHEHSRNIDFALLHNFNFDALQ